MSGAGDCTVVAMMVERMSNMEQGEGGQSVSDLQGQAEVRRQEGRNMGNRGEHDPNEAK